MTRKKILYVEDDETLGFLTTDSLKIKGFEAILCTDGESAIVTFVPGEFDICILDIMLPKIDGFEVAKHIRKLDKDIPIIFLSAKSLTEDKVAGLKIGADDYMVKPFSIEELALKIEVFLKRYKVNYSDDDKEFIIGKYILNCETLELHNNKTKLRLTSKEMELLKHFAQNKNKILKRDDILLKVWGSDDYFLGRSLDVFVSRLRKYLSGDTSITIENVHGVGFMMRID